MFDFNNLKMSDIIRCGIAVRSLGSDAKSMEDAATRYVDYIHDNFMDPQSGEKTCVLVRLFKTHDFDKLPEPLQKFATNVLKAKTPSSFKCLTLLASAGVEKQWFYRRQSKNHQAIPLPSKEVLNRIPMICNLVKQMGLDVETVIRPDPELLADLSQKTFNVFYVPDALNSPYVPAQDDFVKPYGIKSVLGFGGIMPSGNVYVSIIFSKMAVSLETAGLFNILALNLKMLLMPFEGKVFS